MTEEAELQEAIRRSLSEQGETGEEEGQREGERRQEDDDSTSENVQAAIERSILHREGSSSNSASASTDSGRPPPYNPHFPPESSSSDATTDGPRSSVGWNRDLLETSNDTTDTVPRPLGFDALHSDSDSIPTRPSGNTGTDLRYRGNQARDTHHSGTGTSSPAAAAQNRDSSEERGTGSLTREEMREARLLRLGGSGTRERERRPLSELASQSFTFKK